MKPRFLVLAKILLPFFTIAVLAQTAPPAQSPAPVPYSSVSQLNILLSQVEQTSQGMLADLSRVRVDKWKTDSNTKRDSQSDVESVQRNLQSALPEMLNQLRAFPESLPATFKLYRNFDALYDVFSSIVESAGAFGSKDDFQSLRNDLSELERSRKAFADRMDTLASSKEQEVAQLRTQLHDLQAAQAAAPPKKTVVDDTAPPAPTTTKKKTTKKKPATPATPPASTQQQGSTSPQQ
jgi:hypothetical protein